MCVAPGVNGRSVAREGRKQLVGLLTENPKYVIPHGSHLTENITHAPDFQNPVKTVGWVSSTYWSETLGHSIAMALLENGQNRMGEQLLVRNINGDMEKATVTQPVFFDPKGERANA